MKIAVASDHAAYEQKNEIVKLVQRRKHQAVDLGTHGADSVDYPDYALALARKVASGECDRGILLCGTGIGMSIAANKVHGIRAALCHDAFTAEMSRRHNDANVLCLGARVLSLPALIETATVWLDTDFEGGRHARRVQKMMDAEKSES